MKFHSVMRRRLVRLAVIAVSLGCSVLAVADEFEPNDTLVTASPAPFSLNFDGFVGALFLGNGEHGELDVDLFAIVVPDEWTLPVSLTARALATETGTDLMLRLFDANGLELANNDDSNDIIPFTPFLSTLLLSHGTYYVGVSSAGNPIYDPHTGGTGRSAPGGAYDLNLSGGSPNYRTSLYEPNDTSSAATSMGSGSFAVTGEWIGDNAFGRLDVDVYKITLMQPARLDIIAKSADGLFDPVIRVRSCEDPLPTPTTMDECSLGSADDQPDGSGDARLVTAMFEPGDVFIMVSGSGNRGFNPAIAGSGEPGSVGSYELTVTVTPMDLGLPDEPNDAILMATQTPLLIEGRPDSFSIDAFLGDGPYALLRGDRDFYALRLIESQIVSITIEAGSLGSSLVPVLVAYDSRGRMLAYADASSSGGDATLTLPAGCIVPNSESNPSVVLMVMGIKQRLPNNLFDPLYWYQSKLIGEHIVEDGPGSTGAYRLTVAVEESDAGCAIEPNDSVSTATETGLVDEGSYFCVDLFWGDSHCAQPQADVDMWTFQVTHPPVRLRAEASDCDAFDPFDLRLYDAGGSELAMVDGDIGLGQTGTSIVLTAELQNAQRYFLVASSDDAALNINNPCSCSCWSAEAPYDISITLSPLRSLARTEVAAASERPAENELLFATSLDPESPGIAVYDSVSGSIVSHMASPEPQIGGTGGMAFNGQNLFFLGAGRFPKLYKLDPVTGDVLEQFYLWIGSGYYTGAAMLGDEMYLLDHRRRQVHVVDPVTPRYIRSLSLGFMHDITIGGGIAALSGPNRLYVADAFNTEAIYEIHPPSGAITGTLAALDNRPTAIAGSYDQLLVADFRTEVMEVRNRSDGLISVFPLVAPVGMLASFSVPIPQYDFDVDGDVDLHDVGAFQLCFHQTNETAPCEIADHDHDGIVDLPDAGYLSSFITGP